MSKTQRFRIYVETVDEAEVLWVKSSTSAYFESFTICQHVGYWKGKEEKTTVVELINVEEGDDYFAAFTVRVKALAQVLKVELNQEKVLVVEDEVEASLV